MNKLAAASLGRGGRGLTLGFRTLEEVGSSPDSDFLLRSELPGTGGSGGGGSGGGDGGYVSGGGGGGGGGCAMDVF